MKAKSAYKCHCNCVFDNTGEDVSIIAPESWYPNRHLQEANAQLLGIGTLYQVKQSMRWVEKIEPEG